MASYKEINGLLQMNEESGLRQRVVVATLIAANAIRVEAADLTDATALSRKRFSQSLFRQQFNTQLIFRPDDSAVATQTMFEAVYRMVLAANSGVSLTNIVEASDAQLQSKVDEAVDHLAADYSAASTL